MQYKKIENYILNTSLGVHTCTTEIEDRSDDLVILKPDEDLRLEYMQIIDFCSHIKATGRDILKNQLKYILEVYELSKVIYERYCTSDPILYIQSIAGILEFCRQTGDMPDLVFQKGWVETILNENEAVGCVYPYYGYTNTFMCVRGRTLKDMVKMFGV